MKRRANKIISLILALSLMLSMFTVTMFVSAETETNVWDGWTTTAPVDSDGDGIYEIGTAEELAYIIKVSAGGGKSYKLTADIYLNDITKINWSTGKVEAGYTANSWYYDWGSNVPDFNGTIDGNYHTVYGLYYAENPPSYLLYHTGTALVPVVAENGTAAIYNLGVDYAYLNVETSASAFVAVSSAGSTVIIDNCFAGENVMLKAASTGAFYAYGRNAATGSITNSYSLATTNSPTGRYGLIGTLWNTPYTFVVNNCYNANGPVTTFPDSYYYVDANSTKNNYVTEQGDLTIGVVAVLSKTQMQGENALKNMGALNNYGNYYTATDTYPVLSGFKGIKVNEIWNGTTKAPADANNDGVYEITNGAELAYAISTGGAADAKFILTSDIYLNNVDKINWATGETIDGYVPNVWYEDVAFQGSIDGDGHVVYGLYNNNTTATPSWKIYGNGLIPRVAANTSVSITKLGVDKAYISGVHGVSAFVGCGGDNVATTDDTKARINIDQCYAGANVTLKGYDTGAFRGATRGSVTTVTNSYSLADIQGTKVGIIGGEAYDATISVSNVFATNTLPVTEAWNRAYTFKNIYATDAGSYTYETQVRTLENMQGLDALTNAEKMPALNTDKKFVATEGYPVLIAFLGYEIDVDEAVWDGTTTAPSDSNGDGVYEIGTAEELAFIIANGGGYSYKLTSDIYINDIDYINWETGEITLGYFPNSWYNNTSFSGSIDGDGHTVYGLYYNVPETTGWGYQGVGLVPRVNSGASVKITNLAIDNAYISAVNAVSAFVGFTGPTYHNEEAEAANATIENCYAGEKVTLKGHHAGVFRGATFRSNTTIKNCYTFATTITLSAEGGAAGVFGNEWTSTVTVKNVYNANGGVGGQEASLAGKTFSGVYVTDRFAGNALEYPTEAFTVLSTNNMQGRDVFENPRKLYHLNDDGAFEATNGYPILVAFIKDVADAPVADNDVIWEGNQKDTEPTKTDANGNILITSAEELAYIIENEDFGSADTTYKLTTNIYLNDIDKINWETGEPIGDYVPNQWYENTAFQGTIDGNGYIIYGLYSNVENTEYKWGYWGQGLIPRVNADTSVTIKNLGINNAFINATNAGGAFVGFAGPKKYDESLPYANVNIEQCFVGENVSVNAHNAGAFVGAGLKGDVNIKNSYSLGNVNSTDFDGCSVDFAPSGFVGNDWTMTVTVNNSYNAKGTIQGWWDNTTYSNSKNNYATGYDIDKTANGGELEAFYATKIDASNMQGLDVFTSADKMWRINADSVYTATKGYPELTVFIQRGNSAALRIWDGTTMAPTNGSGSQSDPYIISYAAELAYIISTGGAANTYYKLANDIYLNNIYMIDWATGEAAEGYTPNSWYENIAFQGNIDGDGNVVYGLYFNDGKELSDFGYYFNSGLIPEVNDGTSVSIKNLGIDNAFVHTAQCASAFVGYAGTPGNVDASANAQVVIDNCYAGAKVYLEGGDTGVFRGGAKAADTVVSNSYSLANTVGAKYNGLIGNFWAATATFTNVYNANGCLTTQEAPVITATDVYATEEGYAVAGVTVISADQMIGENALNVMKGLDADVFTAVHNYYPVLDKFAENTIVKNNRLYYGVSLTAALDYYTTASGEQYFWRYDNILVNDDNTMDIADLVFLTLQYDSGKAKADIDGDGSCTLDDMKVLRKALMGRADSMTTPMHSFGNYTPVTAVSSDYQFVWGDEFDGSSLDMQKWGIYAKMDGSSLLYDKDGNKISDYGDVVNSSGEDAIAVEDGNLRLTAYKTDAGTYVTPTSVVTQNTMNFKQGYVEIRAKFPVQDGVWSSWWTKSVFDKSDTYCLALPDTEVGAEIDMIEVFDTNQATFNIIKWWANDEGGFSSWYPNDENHAFKQEITSDRYYVFGYEWTEDEVIMYCDGVEYGRYDITQSYTEKIPGRNNNVDKSGTNMDCFDSYQFLIFNNHLFYPTVSNAEASVTENPNFTSADFLIDYCRVYQKAGSGAIVTK
ncbi:MAG: family 16 glycosylhydrolase [Clostridia bacterium]|nr:family 16 glycosylhydrolase [Clostridia bacterium]